MSTFHIPRLIALTSTVSNNEISHSQLSDVAGALQRQATEDLLAAWTHVPISVLAVADPNKIPHGYNRIEVRDDIQEPGAAGYHTDLNGQPYALVQFDSGWALTASHEFVEMAMDPLGGSLYRAPSPDPALAHVPKYKKVVRILNELADPCEGSQYSYPINGIQMSDFITHNYGNGTHGPFSHTGAIKYARQVLPDGYISWEELDGTWKQLTNWNGPQVHVLGKRTEADKGLSLREWVDQHTRIRKAS